MGSWNSCLSFSALFVVTCIRSSAYWHARLRHVVWCENTGLVVCSVVQIACLSHFQLYPPSSFSEAKAGQSRKTLPDDFTSLLVKTCTVPPRGASWIRGALRLQAKLCGISEQVAAPEVQCA